MADNFRIFGPGERPRSNGYGGGMPRPRSELELAREELAHYRSQIEDLKDEPLPTATVVEIRKRDDGSHRMLIAIGPGNALDINWIEGASVGDRVRCNRQTMQAIDVLRDAVPTGTIVTAQRQNGGPGGLVEAETLGMLRAFRADGFTIAKGERVIVDPSMTFVIGTLGMPPAAFSFSPKVSVSWDDVGGHAEAKAALREAIELPFSHKKLFAAYGKRPVRGVMLSGPSGCGKTLLAKAAATSIAKAHGKLAADGFVYVKGPELINPYIGKSEQAIRGLFEAARTHYAEHGYPAVIFLDECDALLGARDRGMNISINATTVPQFLAEMDGMDDHATMLILATNRPDMLDPAITREGRIDRRVKVGRPNLDDACAILEIHLRDRPMTCTMADAAMNCAIKIYDDARIVRELEPGRVLRLRDFVSGAMIAGIVEQASTAAMMRDIDGSISKASGISLDDLRWSVDRAAAALANVNHAEAIKEHLEQHPIVNQGV